MMRERRRDAHRARRAHPVEPLGDARDRARRRALGRREQQRMPVVGALAQRRLERHLAEQRDAELLGEAGAAALAEGRGVLAAAGARVARHVLDDADERLADLLHHRGRALGDALRGGLRRRDDDRLGARHQLPEREPDVARARRHVDDEVVELAPVHVGEELLERAVQHRAAPDDRALLLEEEADRHHAQVVGDRRDDHAVEADRALLDAEHAGHRPAVDVGVDDADLAAEVAQREREVDRERRLADAALAGGDGDHAGAGIDREALRRGLLAARQPGLERGALLLVHVREAHLDASDAGDGRRVMAHLALEVLLERAAGHRQDDLDHARRCR